MDKKENENIPTLASSPLSLPTHEDPLLVINSGSSSNGNKSSRTSSIEALNWSDFEDDDDEANNGNNDVEDENDSQCDVKQNIPMVPIATTSSDSQVQQPNISTSTCTLMGDSTMNTSTTIIEPNKTKMDESFEHLEEDLDNIIRIRRSGSGVNDAMITSYVSMASDTSSVAPDQMSTAPVLDDGPIWSKGMKHYRFEENRLINQKLTFCVLLSVVLAIGLGLGNLVAYNECEAEHKILDQQVCSKYDERSPPSVTPTTATTMPLKATRTATESSTTTNIPNPKIIQQSATTTIPSQQHLHTGSIYSHQIKSSMEFPSSPSSSSSSSGTVTLDEKKIKPDKPMIDPNYKLHAEELSRVLKMLDDLSRKIDQFENTTRQLGGIIMMRDEYVKPKSPKSKFLKLLDEIVHTKGGLETRKKAKNPSIDNDNNNIDSEEKDWNVEAEKVLDKIAEAVLNVMNSDILNKKVEDPIVREEQGLDEEETKLETKDVFQFDDSLIISGGKDDDIAKEEHEHDDDDDLPIVFLEPAKTYEKSSSNNKNKFGDDSDLEFEYHGDNGQIKDSFSNEPAASDVEDFDEYKEKHQKLKRNKKDLKDKPSKDKDNRKVKKEKSKHDKKRSSNNNNNHDNKNYKKEHKNNNNENGKGKNIIQDWQADRAKLRQETRYNYPKVYPKSEHIKKYKNWQVTRGAARERIRDNILSH